MVNVFGLNPDISAENDHKLKSLRMLLPQALQKPLSAAETQNKAAEIQFQ